MVYRSDFDALLEQCEALKRRLAAAEVDARELERLRDELRDKTRELERLRAKFEPTSTAPTFSPPRRFPVALAITGALIVLATGLFFALTSPRVESPYGPPSRQSPHTKSAAEVWFESARPHCNPLEVRDFLSRSQPPSEPLASAYVAACWALGGRIDEARSVILVAEAAHVDHSLSLSVLLYAVHPTRVRGDDQVPGPIMDLAIELWPENYFLVYHAGMTDYAGGNTVRATSRLQRFIEMEKDFGLCKQCNAWLAYADRALAGMRDRKAFAEIFAGERDPRND